MMMAMMIIAVAVVLHFVVAAAVGTWSETAVEQWSIALEAVRRVGVALYLVAITHGLGTIITVLHFQATRIRQLPAEPGSERPIRSIASPHRSGLHAGCSR